MRCLLLALCSTLLLIGATGCPTAEADTPVTEEPTTEAAVEPAPAAEVATFAVPGLDDEIGKQLALAVGEEAGVVSAKPIVDKGQFQVTFTPGQSNPDGLLARIQTVSSAATLEGVAVAEGGAAKTGCGGCPSKSKCPKAQAEAEAAAAAAEAAAAAPVEG